MHQNTNTEEIEIALFLEGIFNRYGYDFRDYAQASLKRRIKKTVEDEKVDSITAFLDRILHHPEAMERFLLNVSITVTSLFRDPEFYNVLRNRVLPELKLFPFIRIWIAGCSTGEEVFSVAILLKEAGLLEKTRIYATDMNEVVLEKAQSGIFSLKNIQDYTRNYQKAGGKTDFSHYYTAKYENAIFDASLVNKVVWAQHNLVSDGSFNEFHLTMCRNVMIYFNRNLQSRVHQLLYDSLAVGGFLALGNKESLRFTPYEENYEVLEEGSKIYKRIR